MKGPRLMAANQNLVDQLDTLASLDAELSGPAEITMPAPTVEQGLRLTVFSKNECPECTSAKRFLIKRGVPYREINVETETEPRAEFDGLTPFDYVVKTYGRKMPTMVLEDGSWGDWWPGARPDKLIEVVRRFKEVGLLVPEDQRHG